MAASKDPTKRLIIAIPILLVASFGCYILSHVFFAIGGGDDSAVETVTSGVTDSNAADTFAKIAAGLRIMPSHQTEGNLLMMVADNGTAEHQDDYSDSFTGGMSEDYFTTDHTQDYFPEFPFTENTVPLGNAKPFCMHVDWSTKANRKVLDKYYGVQDFPLCALAQNHKFRWQEQDPKDGLDFALWKQHSNKVASADDCDSSGIFVKSKTQKGGVCYKYDVIESVCIGIAFKVNEETASYGWSYEGGCFEDGRIANYNAAVPGTVYNFDKLDFEVRETSASLAEKVGNIFSMSGLFGWLALVFLVGAFISGVVFAYQAFKKRQSEA